MTFKFSEISSALIAAFNINEDYITLSKFY